MPDEKDKLKLMLKTAAVSARKYATERQLDEAAQELTSKDSVTKHDLKRIGEKVASDGEIFANTDIDDINTVLDTLKKK